MAFFIAAEQNKVERAEKKSDDVAEASAALSGRRNRKRKRN